MSDDNNNNHMILLDEIKSLHKRISTMESQIEAKIDRLSDMFREDHKELQAEVNRLNVELAVLKNDMKVKTTTVASITAVFISSVIAIVAALITHI